MDDFITIIDWIFVRLGELWTFVMTQWILVIGILFIILNWVITLINGSRQQ